MTEPLVKVQNLRHQFKDKVLFENLSFQIFESEVVMLTGPSGQGKSTLFKILCGLEKVQSGALTVSTKICYQPQDLALSQKIDALENVLLGYRSQFPTFSQQLQKPSPEMTEFAQKLLRDFGLEYEKDKITLKYSGGEQQRIALARSLMTQTKILLLDEPFSQLDWERSCQLLQMISDECHLRGRSALIIVHDQRLIDLYADRVLSLSDVSEEGLK